MAPGIGASAYHSLRRGRPLLAYGNVPYHMDHALPQDWERNQENPREEADIDYYTTVVTDKRRKAQNSAANITRESLWFGRRSQLLPIFQDLFIMGERERWYGFYGKERRLQAFVPRPWFATNYNPSVNDEDQRAARFRINPHQPPQLNFNQCLIPHLPERSLFHLLSSVNITGGKRPFAFARVMPALLKQDQVVFCRYYAHSHLGVAEMDEIAEKTFGPVLSCDFTDDQRIPA